MAATVGILVGGTSRRMGRDKALIEIGGICLIERVAATAASVVDEIILLGRPSFSLPKAMASLPVIEDRHPGVGPIAGLEALLSHRPRRDAILLACDMPRLNETLVRRLVDVEGEFDAAVCLTRPSGSEAASRWHPCCASYRPTALPAVQSALRAGRYSMVDLMARLRVGPIILTGREATWVDNWNTPEDVEPQPEAKQP